MKLLRHGAVETSAAVSLDFSIILEILEKSSCLRFFSFSFISCRFQMASQVCEPSFFLTSEYHYSFLRFNVSAADSVVLDTDVVHLVWASVQLH